MAKAESIFQEPPDNIDETFTHGALLGGMIGYSEEQIADSYFECGNALVECVLSGRLVAREVINPVMFAYRHGVELFLKYIVQPKVRDHNLGKLLELFCEHIRGRYDEDVPDGSRSPFRSSSSTIPEPLLFDSRLRTLVAPRFGLTYEGCASR